MYIAYIVDLVSVYHSFVARVHRNAGVCNQVFLFFFRREIEGEGRKENERERERREKKKEERRSTIASKENGLCDNSGNLATTSLVVFK